MTILDFFNRRSETFTPFTPIAAIKAYESGILPIEHFIYKCTSSISLDEEVVNLTEVERLLAKKDLDIYANCILVDILERLTHDPDQEIALLAAESINLIESRYNQQIEAIKTRIKEEDEPVAKVRLARLYYELGLINYKKETIRLFYFKEAYQNYKEVVFLEKIDFKDLEILVEILIELGQADNAISILEFLNKDNNVFLLFLIAEVEFERRNYTKVYTIIDELFQRKDELNAKLGMACAYWMDAPWIERSEFA